MPLLTLSPKSRQDCSDWNRNARITTSGGSKFLEKLAAETRWFFTKFLPLPQPSSQSTFIGCWRCAEAQTSLLIRTFGRAYRFVTTSIARRWIWVPPSVCVNHDTRSSLARSSCHGNCRARFTSKDSLSTRAAICLSFKAVTIADFATTSQFLLVMKPSAFKA